MVKLPPLLLLTNMSQGMKEVITGPAISDHSKTVILMLFILCEVLWLLAAFFFYVCFSCSLCLRARFITSLVMPYLYAYLWSAMVIVRVA